MFAGIIEARGMVETLRLKREGALLAVAAGELAGELRTGESVAINGVCLTTVEAGGGVFSCDLSAETLRRTTFKSLKAGMAVNLERPLAVGERIGGHFVLGHVDGIGRVLSKVPVDDGCVMNFQFPCELERYIVYKGSISVDGISLTIASIQNLSFSVAVIPHTLRVTNLRDLNPGDDVNLETDILGKYLDRFYQLGLNRGDSPQLTFEYLKEQGFK